MSANTPGFIGARLIQARVARGLSAVDFADLVGLSVQSISKYENGHQSPKPEVLFNIAATLKLPQSFFLRPLLHDDRNPIFWRGKLSAPVKPKDKAEVKFSWMKEIVDYLAEFFDFPALSVPVLNVDDIHNVGLDELERIADEIRDFWGIRKGPMPDIIDKLESNGILVFRIHIGAEKLDAFSQWSDRFDIPLVVLSRDKTSAVRQRFDCLHELSHIVAHRSVSRKNLNDRKTYKSIEDQANRLACCLLLPEKEFLEELYAPSLDGFLALKERWGASVAAMIVRCKDLEVLNEKQYERMWINYNRRGWRKGEPLDGKIKKEAPQLIRKSFEMLIEEKVQSVEDILKALPFPPKDIEESADLTPGTLTNNTDAGALPTLKKNLAQGTNNVVSIFDKK
ncbi:MAG: XRE family transcriptional regulator [Candidatus Competibacteraceae bacterium]|jgi:Zn-dependent peptidase ImmA (M78 family)/DNA-binding XRE family transcriptional regulator|nr:XRE family transcriptional regulator [Candidatus Competibacteraceae bacterium]